MDLALRIDALLPQTQCGQCGFAGCKPYADAIASGAAEIDQCPPGGDEGVAVLARLLGRAPKPVNPANGAVKSRATVAVIDEAVCIGCTKCIQACPVDAIAGAAQLMHTVIADECSGCELCIPPCPVDCIRMDPADEAIASLAPLQRAPGYRKRFEARGLRIEREQRAEAERRNARRSQLTGDSDPVAAALARVRARKSPDA